MPGMATASSSSRAIVLVRARAACSRPVSAFSSRSSVMRLDGIPARIGALPAIADGVVLRCLLPFSPTQSLLRSQHGNGYHAGGSRERMGRDYFEDIEVGETHT